MFTPKAPPRNVQPKPKLPPRPKEIEFEVGKWKVFLSSNGMMEIEGGPKTWDHVTTHINYDKAKALGEVFVDGVDDPLDCVSSKDWEEIQRVAQKYLDNKAFL